MQGLMMTQQLTLPVILSRAETLFGAKEIISRAADKSVYRYTYRDFAFRVKKLAAALGQMGLREGDRVATLCWNHAQHMEVYYAAPCSGLIVHPLNIRFSPQELTYIVNHAEDKILILDQVLLPLWEKIRETVAVSRVIVIRQSGEPIPEGYLDYEEVVSLAEASLFHPFEKDEYTAAFLCYTSGTTGKPKGVLYSHRSIMLHAMASLLSTPGVGITERDVVLPVVPMFHASAWGFPYMCALVGASLVYPGPYLDSKSLLELFESEKVTITGGVPTVMMALLEELDSSPNRYKINLRTILIGGSCASRYLVESFENRYQVTVLNTWGMTEISPMGSTAIMTTPYEAVSKEQQYAHRIRQGFPVPLLQIRARNESGLIPHDGSTVGELEVKGPCVAASYYQDPESGDKFSEDGWLRTGDIVAIGADGCIEIKDRSKDVIKSGGEWISSVALENALLGHPAVLEAAVIGIPDPKWIERPFAFVVTRHGKTVSSEELKAFLKDKFAKFWIPDLYGFIEAIPKNSVGKLQKSALRERYAKEYAVT